MSVSSTRQNLCIRYIRMFRGEERGVLRSDLVCSKLILKVQFWLPQRYYAHIYHTSDDTDKCNCVHMPDHKNSPALCCVHAVQHVHSSRIVMVRQNAQLQASLSVKPQ